MEQLTEEQGNKQKALRDAWMKKVGDGMVDLWSSMANGKTLADNGQHAAASDLNGSSIV